MGNIHNEMIKSGIQTPKKSQFIQSKKTKNKGKDTQRKDDKYYEDFLKNIEKKISKNMNEFTSDDFQNTIIRNSVPNKLKRTESFEFMKRENPFEFEGFKDSKVKLNIYTTKVNNNLRNSYISKLITKNKWIPNQKAVRYNSLIIFDWDDTLLPTTVIAPKGEFNSENLKLGQFEIELLNRLESFVYKILSESIEKGNTYIITNAAEGWVEYSTSLFYPKVVDLLKKITIISAREKYEKQFPNNNKIWKKISFLDIKDNYPASFITNIVCIGDSEIELSAGGLLAKSFENSVLKTVKFKSLPRMDELARELNLLVGRFNVIFNNAKNEHIVMEKLKRNSL